jgi:phosphoserine aminotransferase
VAPKSESDDKMLVQVICAPQKKPTKKTTINTLDVSAVEMDYQKKLKWLKEHGELTGEECNTNNCPHRSCTSDLQKLQL